MRAGSISYYNTGGGVSTVNTAGIAGYDPRWNWRRRKLAELPQQAVLRSPTAAPTPAMASTPSGTTSTPQTTTTRQSYVGRGDYNINDKMKLFARFTIAREDAVNQPNQFPGDPVTSPFTDRSYAFVVGHNWVIGSKQNQPLLPRRCRTKARLSQSTTIPPAAQPSPFQTAPIPA